MVQQLVKTSQAVTQPVKLGDYVIIVTTALVWRHNIHYTTYSTKQVDNGYSRNTTSLQFLTLNGVDL